MQKMLEDSGHTLLYLPPHSLDLNPIEKNGPKLSIRRTTSCSIDELFKLHLA